MINFKVYKISLFFVNLHETSIRKILNASQQPFHTELQKY